MFKLFKKKNKKTNNINMHEQLRNNDAEFRKIDDYNNVGDKQINRINKLRNKTNVTNNEMIDLYLNLPQFYT